MGIDVVIIGGGPAGLSAGIFTSRAGLKTVLFEGLAIGGQASLSYNIENYPAFESISGFDLCEKMRKQAQAFGVEIKYEKILKVEKEKNGFLISCNENSYKAKRIIIASGCKNRLLGLKDEQRLTGRGISYCASCDGNFFKGKNVAVVGGGKTAIEDVDYLSRIANKIYLINRSEIFRAGEREIKRIKKYKNLEILSSSKVLKANGKDVLNSIEVDKAGEKIEIKIDGLFIAVGQVPNLNFLAFDLKLDDAGYIIVDEFMRTSEKNLYACGDIVSKNFKQVVSACADGALAGNSCVGGK